MDNLRYDPTAFGVDSIRDPAKSLDLAVFKK
jgi:hypothetical protein